MSEESGAVPSVAGDGTNIAGYGFRVIQGGKSKMSDEDARSRIKAILREIDERNIDLTARLLLATIKRELKERWIVVALAVAAACSFEALLFVMHYR